ncbi:Uncharacterised protein [Candidatus Anstonella stagnisolia]|nr:Uncharacterised protein [Candidatus Anstonella stagnisolia]
MLLIEKLVKKVLPITVYTDILGAFALFAVSLLWWNVPVLTLVLLIIAGLLLYMRSGNQEIALFVFCGIAGAVSETIGIFFGAWTYALPTAFQIPLWLPVLWGIAAVFTLRTYEQIEAFWKIREVKFLFRSS